MIRACCYIVAIAVIATFSLAAPTTSPTVGMEQRFEIDIAGAQLESKPVTKKSKLLLRIASATPVGDYTRYDLRYIGLVPGEYDLRDYLLRSDGSATNTLPAMRVYVSKILPDEYDGALAAVPGSQHRTFGGYRIIMWIVAGLWLALLVPLILLRRRTDQSRAPEPMRPITLADRLRPLIEQAARGELSIARKAELERLLMNHWQHELSLMNDDPATAIETMRQHPQAGQLLRALEEWLHRRPGAQIAHASIAQLLEPYRNVHTPIPAISTA